MASLESMLRFVMPVLKKKAETLTTVARVKFLLKFEAQKTIQERIIVESL